MYDTELNKYLDKFESWDTTIRRYGNCCVLKEDNEMLSLFVVIRGIDGYFIQNKNSEDLITFVVRK